MAYPKRSTTSPNTIKLTLDFRTLDKLRALADARRVDLTRCAYELLQAALETIEIPDHAPGQRPALPEPEDRMGELAARLTSQRPPQG